MQEKIKVAVRIRPDKNQQDIKITPHTIFIDKQNYIFDNIFNKSSQENIYSTVVKDCVSLVCQGYNATIFTYGSTGTGKTYTMFGKKDHLGIIPRTCEDIFSILSSTPTLVDSSIKCSFLEIYQEKIRDLLCNDSHDLQIRQNDIKGIYVQGLTEKLVYSSSEILEIIKEGTIQRSTSSTALNNVSSRSHSVLTLTISQTLGDGSECTSKLHLIDLAGSENVGKSEVQGIALSEAKMINRSLSCLGNVIFALTEDGREHIPYRDSKLTYLLQNSLGGNSKTIVIATISLSPESLSETINTLKFVKRIKEIKNVPKINRNEGTINLHKVISEQSKKISLLEETVKELEKEKSIMRESLVTNNNDWEIKLVQEENKKLSEKINSELIKSSDLEKIFTLQKERTISISQKLYNETIKNYLLDKAFDEYKLMYENLKDTNPTLLNIILEKQKLSINIDKNSVHEDDFEED